MRIPRIRKATPDKTIPERIGESRALARWIRDMGSAMIVGGATVSLTLLLTDLDLREDSFVAFEMAFFLVVGLARACEVGVGETTGAGGGGLNRRLWFLTSVVQGGIVAAATFVGADSFGFGGHWPIKSETTVWWIVVATALLLTWVGAEHRHFAEDVTARLDKASARIGDPTE